MAVNRILRSELGSDFFEDEKLFSNTENIARILLPLAWYSFGMLSVQAMMSPRVHSMYDQRALSMESYVTSAPLPALMIRIV
jgi:hypothetical protein